MLLCGLIARLCNSKCFPWLEIPGLSVSLMHRCMHCMHERRGGPHRESAPNLHDRPRTDRTRVPPSPVRWPRRSPARSSDRNARRASQTVTERRPVSAAPAPVRSPPAEAPCANGTCSDSSVKSDSAAGKNDPCAGNQVSSFTPRARAHTHLCARSSR